MQTDIPLRLLTVFHEKFKELFAGRTLCQYSCKITGHNVLHGGRQNLMHWFSQTGYYGSPWSLHAVSAVDMVVRRMQYPGPVSAGHTYPTIHPCPADSPWPSSKDLPTFNGYKKVGWTRMAGAKGRDTRRVRDKWIVHGVQDTCITVRTVDPSFEVHHQRYSPVCWRSHDSRFSVQTPHTHASQGLVKCLGMKYHE